MSNHIIITIDGPAGSGKSSTAKALAHSLGFYYLNTGLLYRAIAYIVTEGLADGGAASDDLYASLQPSDLTFLDRITYHYSDNQPRIIFNQQDITSKLSGPIMDKAASCIAANPIVRQALVRVQRSIVQAYDLVTDGRDCGSVVFPAAQVKFFLTADVVVRAQRLLADVVRSGKLSSLQEMEADLVQRDQRDQERKIAPLVIPDDAVVIDNSTLTLEQTVAEMLECVHEVID